jgi:hypothetical protein
VFRGIATGKNDNDTCPRIVKLESIIGRRIHDF